MHELLKTKDRILTSQRDHARKARAELGPAPLTFLFVTESPLERHGDFALTCPYVRTYAYPSPAVGTVRTPGVEPFGSRTHIKGCVESTLSQQGNGII